MRKRLKRILASFSATAFTAVSVSTTFAIQSNAENVTQASKRSTETQSNYCQDDSCQCHCLPNDTQVSNNSCSEECIDKSGEGISIALLDAGVTDFNVAEKVSFVDDDTIDSAHGNDMMQTLLSIAPYVSVLDVRVLDDNGVGSYSAVEKGIHWAVDNNADIIVMSFAGKDKSSLIEDALAYAEDNNVLVVASAGNDSSSDAFYPAAYPSVISVGASDSNGCIQDFSNYGDFVDTYVQWDNGTSGAAQFIAAASAVIKQNNPDTSVSEIRAAFNADQIVDFEKSSDENADSLVYACATHTHSYTVFKMTAKAATCTTDGVGIYQCSKCSATTSKTIPAYGHSWGSWGTESEATCESPKIEKRKCSKCYGVERREIGYALGHNYSSFKMTAKAATCTSDGVGIYQCTRCSSTQNRVLPAYGHNWGDWYTSSKATCDSPEIQCKKCSNCSGIEKREVGYALGHDYSSFKMTAKAATCTTDGVGIYQCTRCSSTQDRVLPAYGHKWGDWETDTAASCTEGEIQKRKCPNCLGIEKRTVGQPLGHDYSVFKITAKAATCTTDGVGIYQCSRCSSTTNKVIPAYGHKWGEWETDTAASCTEGEIQKRKCPNCLGIEKRTVGQPLGHDYSVFKITAKAATCTTDGVGIYQCSRCSSTTNKVIPAYGHKWGEWETDSEATCTEGEIQKRKCPNCLGVETRTVGQALGHDYSTFKMTAKAATCTTDGVGIYQCTRCSSTTNKVIPAFGHKWGEYVTETPVSCTEAEVRIRKCQNCLGVERITVGSPLGHDYSSLKITAKAATCTTDGVGIFQCTRCSSTTEKVIPAYGHKWGEWTTEAEATCTSPKIQIRKCPNCLMKETKTVGSPLGHDYSVFKLTAKAATCTTDGVGIYQCSRCTSTTNKEIPAFGHKFQWQLTKKATCTESGELVYKCPNCLKVDKKYILSPLGHLLETEYVAATTTSPGYSRTWCTRSGCTYETSNTYSQIGELSIEDCDFDTFYFRSSGALDTNSVSWPLCGEINGKTYLLLNLESNVNWTITSNKSYVHFMNEEGASITGGNAGNSLVYVKMDSFPIDQCDQTREAQITIVANDKSMTYDLVQVNRIINGISKYDYISDINNLISASQGYINPDSEDAKYLRGELLTNGEVKKICFDDTRYIFVSSRALDEDWNELIIEYLEVIATRGKDGNALDPRVEVVGCNNLGMKIIKDTDSPIFTCNVNITKSVTNATDLTYERNLGISKCITVPMNIAKDIYIGYKFPNLDPHASYIVSYYAGAFIDGAGEYIVNSIHENLGDDGVLESTLTFTVNDNCVLNQTGNYVTIHCSSAKETSEDDVVISFIVEDSMGNQYFFTR